MSMVDLFKPVAAWSSDRVRKWLLEAHPESFLLLDVRQKKEYAEGHLPGAIHTPILGLPDKISHFDRDLPLIIYCRFGLRSRAAAALLLGQGFKEVHTLKGGYEAWHGEVAQGLPDTAIGVLVADSVEKMLAVAWILEETTENFYRELSSISTEKGLERLFLDLAEDEKSHKKTLTALYEALFHRQSRPGFARELLAGTLDGIYLEGGIAFEEARRWQKEGPLALVDLAIAIEICAYDRCLNLQRALADGGKKRILEILAGDERRHLKKLLKVYDSPPLVS